MIEPTARTFIKRNLTGGAKKKLITAIGPYLRREGIDFSDYKLSHLKRDVRNGTIESLRGVGSTTVDRLSDALRRG